ncbi:MAG: hypothetical protein MUP09_11990, partial [Thiovulaceae bacterium]|nr:hypothetical protein [Sulfurimonadaceae bacterium]
MEFYLYTALFAPLAGSLLAALFGMSKKNTIVGIVPSLLLFVSFLASLKLAIYMLGGGEPI